jgi:hypothetical protein
MSMHKTIVAVLFTQLFIMSSYAQSEKKSTNSEKLTSHITANLTSPLNTLCPRWRIGYINGLNSKWKIGIEFGYGNSNNALKFIKSGSDILFEEGYRFEENYRLWELRSTIFYKIIDRKVDSYLSLEFFYIKHKDILTDKVYHSKTEGSYFSYDNADFYRQKYGVLSLFNLMFMEKKQFGFLLYVGPGLKIRKQEFTNVENPRLYTGEFSDFMPFVRTSGYQSVEGVKFGVDFNVGIKLLFKVK